MDRSLRIHRLVCRGLEELNPKIWEVWGTARNASAIDVRFVFPDALGDTFGPQKTVTVVPHGSDERWGIVCEPGELLWGARFYAIEHPRLPSLRGWMRAQPDHLVAIEATTPSAAMKPYADAPDPAPDLVARATFGDKDIVTGYEFEAGVLLVHGIGVHPQGDTLIRFSEPIVEFLQQWLRGAADVAASGYTTEGAERWRDRVFETTLRHQQNLFDLTDEIERFVKRAGAPKDGSEALALKAGFLVGDACAIDTILRPLASEPQISGTSLLRLSTAAADGALAQTHLLLSEAWWTNEVASPTPAQLRDWIFAALPQVVSTYCATASYAMDRAVAQAPKPTPLRWRAAQLLDALTAYLLRAPLALLFCAAVQLLLIVLGALALVPLPWVRKLMRPLIGILMGTTGQSYAVVTSEMRRSAIVYKVSKQLDWLCQRCERVIILAHSQGVEISRMVIGNATRSEVQRLIAFGSGVKMLGVLTSEQPSRRHARCAAVVLALLVAALAALWAGLPVSRWLPTAYAGLVLLGSMFIDPPFYLATFRRSVPMTGYYASRDPVPCGPVSQNAALLASINFEEIEVHNRASVILDHTSYLENVEEFVAPVALAVAAAAGMGWNELVEGDRQRLDEARARRRMLVSRKQWIGRWSLLALVVALAATLVVHAPSSAAVMAIVQSAWKGPSGEWSTALQHLPSVLFDALPLVAVAGAFAMERLLLHARFTASARALVRRRVDAGPVPPRLVRAVAYAGLVVMVGWWAVAVDLAGAVRVFFAS